MNEVVAFTDKDGAKKFATADRNGFFYVLNREDGKFLNAWPFVKDITWAKGIDETGRPIYNEENRPGDPSKSHADDEFCPIDELYTCRDALLRWLDRPA